MHMELEGKVFWITGASSGIGRALLLECAGKGATVIASSNDEEELEKAIKDCGNKANKVISAPFDLADTSSIDRIVDETLTVTGAIHYLVNLGGVSQRATIEETPLWLDRKIMEINYFGTIALSKAVLRHMLQQGFGHILVTSSIAGRFGFPLRSAYSASKQALHGFIETLHIENSRKNIRGSVIIPGRVRTNISLNALNSEGRSHGKLDEGQKSGITPEKAARTILRGIHRNKREILVGGNELLMLYIRKYFPGLFFRIAAKIKPT